MPRYDTLLDLFEEWLVSNKDKSKSTAHLYRRIIRRVCSTLGHPVEWTRDNLHQWFLDRKVQAATFNVDLAAVRAFSKYLIEANVIPQDYSVGLEYRNPPERLPKNLPEQTVEEISSTIVDLQDLALFELLFGSGLRRSEAATLVIADLLSKDILQIIGKGDKERRTPITDIAYRAIRDWVLRDLEIPDSLTDNLREALLDGAFWKLREESPDTPVFVRSNGEPVKDLQNPGEWVYHTIKKYGDISPHQLRHTWATELLANGADSLSVKNAGGWSSMKTMEGYRKVLPKEVTRIKSLHPRQLRGS